MRYFNDLFGCVVGSPFQNLPFSGKVDIWEIGFHGKEENNDQLTILSKDELERANKFHFKKDRLRFVLTRSILRVLLSRYLNITPRQIHFGYTEYGKPFLNADTSNYQLEFNVSHSDERALIAISSNGPIGIDVEKKRLFKNYNDIIKGFFSTKEKEVYCTIPEKERLHYFYALWSRKEAYVKALGGGLTITFDTFAMVNQDFVFPDEIVEEQTGYHVRDLLLEGDYVAAVAVQNETPSISRYRI